MQRHTVQKLSKPSPTISLENLKLRPPKQFYSTISPFPLNHELFKSSKVPFAITLNPPEHVITTDGPIIRCNKCASYLNPYAEISAPGLQWKCNFCYTVNNLNVPVHGRFCESEKFSPQLNYSHNTQAFTLPELVHSCLDYRLSESSSGIFSYIFLIEYTVESSKRSLIDVFLEVIQKNIRHLPSNSKISVILFSSRIFLVSRNGIDTVSEDDIPALHPSKYQFHPASFPFSHLSLIPSPKSAENNYGNALLIAEEIISETGGTVLSFLATRPSSGPGCIPADDTELACHHSFYIELTSRLVRNSISVTHFLFPASLISVATFSFITRTTGGYLYNYPGFSRSDPSVFHLSSDLSSFLSTDSGKNALCRIRVSKGVKITDYFGAFHQLSVDVLSLCSFNPGNAFTFHVSLDEPVSSSAICFQFAIRFGLKNREQRIRVFSFCVDVLDLSLKEYYNAIDPLALAHFLCINAIIKDRKIPGSGSRSLYKALLSIIRSSISLFGSSSFNIPDGPLHQLISLVNSVSKSVSLRPQKYTPPDFKAFYNHLFLTARPETVYSQIYPTLIALHHPSFPVVRLSLDFLEIDGFYLLDTGVAIFFFIGRDCPPDLPSLLFNTQSGIFVYNPPVNNFSDQVTEILTKLQCNRVISPSFVVVRDDGHRCFYRKIFFSYFFDDKMYETESIVEFLKKLEKDV